jgi:DNA polymerase V
LTQKSVKQSRSAKQTKVMRVPVELANQIETYCKNSGYRLPLLSGKVPAGFPLNSTEHVEEWVDINQLMIKDPGQMFLIEATGDSMEQDCIYDGDLLMVDGSIEPRHGMIVIAALDGEYTVKRFFNQGGDVKLIPANSNYPEIEVTASSNFSIAGVVVRSMHKFTY